MVRVLMPNGESSTVGPTLTVEKVIRHCVGDKFSPQNDYALVFFGRKLSSDQRLADVPHLDDESRSVRLICRKKAGLVAELNRTEVDKLVSQCKTMYQNLGEELQQKLDTYMIEQNGANFNAIIKDHPQLLHDSLAISIVGDMQLLVPAIITNKDFAYERPICAKILKKALLQFGIMQQRPDTMMGPGHLSFPGQRNQHVYGRGRGREAITTPAITHDMLSEAMNMAFGDPPAAGPSRVVQPQATTTSATVAPSASAQNLPDFSVQLVQLHEYGFVNDAETVQVLAMTDGDVEQALQILIAMREDN